MTKTKIEEMFSLSLNNNLLLYQNIRNDLSFSKSLQPSQCSIFEKQGVQHFTSQNYNPLIINTNLFKTANR